jgi:hypothetical protein
MNMSKHGTSVYNETSPMVQNVLMTSRGKEEEVPIPTVKQGTIAVKVRIPIATILIIGGSLIFLVTASGEPQEDEPLMDWAPGKIKLDEDGHYRGPNLKPYSGEAQKKTVDHSRFGKTSPQCQRCHSKQTFGYDYVSTEKFENSGHYQAMLKKGQVKNIEDACIVCHVGNNSEFIPYPGDNLIMPEPFDIKKVVNDNSQTCGKCHGELTEKNKDHVMSTAKGHYYRSELFPYHEALGANAEFIFKNCSTCHTSCASSCHMIGEDRQAIDWTFVQPYLDQKIGEPEESVRVKIAEGVEMQAQPIKEYLVGKYIKGGGPGYRMLAKKGQAPMETIKLDIASHEFVNPTNLPRRVADDICLRCHTCMIDPQDRLDTTLAHQSVRCVDCHRDGDVHGHSPNSAKFAFQAPDASCTTCHLREDLYKGKALTSSARRELPIVNPDIYAVAPPISAVSGAHEKVACTTCHSEGPGQCNYCHVGDLQITIGDTLEFGKKPVYYGTDKKGIVRFMLAHEIFGSDGNTYGGWVMKHTVHGIKKDANADCEACHTDAVRMGIGIPERKLINTYLLDRAGVSGAFIDKVEHYKDVKAATLEETCVSCHAKPGSNSTAHFHQTVRMRD